MDSLVSQTTGTMQKVDVLYCTVMGCDFVRYKFDENCKSTKHICADGMEVTLPMAVCRNAFGSFDDLPSHVRVRYLASYLARANELKVTDEALNWVWNAAAVKRTVFVCRHGVISTEVQPPQSQASSSKRDQPRQSEASSSKRRLEAEPRDEPSKKRSDLPMLLPSGFQY